MSIARHHAEWLSLVEVSGPFLSMPVLLRVFPQGLDASMGFTFFSAINNRATCTISCLRNLLVYEHRSRSRSL
jgi:hypothetical protein